MEPKQKQHPVVDVTGDGSKVWCCKEQYCIGTWNVRPMNQGKLEVAKQEMARVNIDILGISELKWTRMGKFSSDDHYIYNWGQEYLRKKGIALMGNKRVQNAVLGCNLKNNRKISVHLKGKAFNVTVIQVYASITNAKKVEAKWVPWRPTRSSRSNTKKGCTFHHRGLESKVGSQEISGVTDKFGLGVQNEAEQRLTEFCQENTLVIANTLYQPLYQLYQPLYQPHKWWLYTHGHHQMVNIKIRPMIFFAKDGEVLYS